MNFLTISDLERGKKTDPVFVLNTASDSAIKISGEILLTIPKVNGTGHDPLKIEQTWLPQEVTLQIPRAQLLRSTEFRGALNRKLIAVISEKEARRLLSMDGADEEQQRLDAQREHMRTAGAARSITDSPTEIHGVDGNSKSEKQDSEEHTIMMGSEDSVEKSVAVQAAAGVSDVEDGITAQFSMLVDRWNTLTDVKVVNEIRGRRKFSTKELRYLQRNLDKQFTKALTMVANNLSRSKK